MKCSTIPSTVAMTMTVFTMAPFSCNHFKKVSTCASSLSPNNNGLPCILHGSFVTWIFIIGGQVPEYT